MDDLMRRVDQQFVAQLPASGPSRVAAPVRVPAGIVSYQAVRTGDDTLMTITTFESEQLLDQARQGAADIRESLAEFHVEEIETFTGEVEISLADEKLLSSLRPT